MPLRDPMRWARAEAVRLARLRQVRYCVLAVSYTHLTLQTILLV